VKGLAQLLNEMYDDLSPEQIKETCNAIYRSADNVYRLLENLLEWSRLQMGRMAYQPKELDLIKIVEQNINLLTEIATNKNITLQSNISISKFEELAPVVRLSSARNVPDSSINLDTLVSTDALPELVEDNPLFVWADAHMLDTVIRNLSSNALKFTPQGGSVTISARKLEGLVEISVTDTGVGISQADIDKLFKTEIHHTTRGTNDEKGTGLGLIMCYEMIEKHGGKIWVESEVGKGTTFKFTLPHA
jgi:signal transduction histidine kinase